MVMGSEEWGFGTSGALERTEEDLGDAGAASGGGGKRGGVPVSLSFRSGDGGPPRVVAVLLQSASGDVFVHQKGKSDVHAFLLDAFLWTVVAEGGTPREAAITRIREVANTQVRRLVELFERQIDGAGLVSVYSATIPNIEPDGIPPFTMPALLAANPALAAKHANTAPSSPLSSPRRRALQSDPALSGPEAGRFLPQRSLAPLLKASVAAVDLPRIAGALLDRGAHMAGLHALTPATALLPRLSTATALDDNAREGKVLAPRAADGERDAGAFTSRALVGARFRFLVSLSRSRHVLKGRNQMPGQHVFRVRLSPSSTPVDALDKVAMETNPEGVRQPPSKEGTAAW
ncbi:hypothetical protein T484DRAFT_3353214 [Baffinella frigidus]|nr:hypothetical protein T484DRAFT_3353214 [Cryptophyta sp. CCMP2293]